MLIKNVTHTKEIGVLSASDETSSKTKWTQIVSGICLIRI